MVCAEYSAELQLKLLGLQINDLAEPILDLGCGAQARLVNYLQQLGKTVFGVDRSAAPSQFVSQGDWLSFPLAPANWGTIISHLGFSQHFLRQHLLPTANPARYAKRYMEILGALRVGGTFAYAPGLPFIENLLPQRNYCVTTKTIDGLPADEPIEQSLRELLGTSPFYACQVKRIAL